MKHRGNLYLVVREDTEWPKKSGHVCGAYSTMEAADNVAASYNQQWEDKGWDKLATFSVIITTFYDE